MKAMIMAAGKGSRISKNIGEVPKSTLPTLDGTPIIRRSVKMMLDLGLEPVLCVGYRSDLIKQALALRIKQNDNSRVYVFLGDGECDEGSVWEAASLAGHMGLDNIIVIVDRNGLQIDGYTRDINNMDKLEDRWKAFGFEVDVIDGHNVEAIHAALSSERHGCPRAIVADTVKGKGVSFAENEVEWHQNVLTDELYARALKDVREGIS